MYNNVYSYTNCLDGTKHFLSQQKAYSFLHPFTNICCLNGDCCAKQEIAFPILADECGTFSNTESSWAASVPAHRETARCLLPLWFHML